MKKNKYISKLPFIIVITALIMTIMNLTVEEKVYRYDIDHIQNSASTKGKVFNQIMYFIDQKFGRYGVSAFYGILFLLFLPFAFNWVLIFNNIKGWLKKQKKAENPQT